MMSRENPELLFIEQMLERIAEALEELVRLNGGD